MTNFVRNGIAFVDASFVHGGFYLVKRGSKPYEGWVRGTTPVAIRCPGPDEASVAFRLVHHRPPSTAVRKETEIVLHDGCYFWPIHEWDKSVWRSRTSFSPPDESITADRLRHLLACANPLFCTPEESSNARYTRGDLPEVLGEWLENDHDARLADVQEKAWEHLLICGGRAYARGGPPLYVQVPLGQGLFDTGTANPGFDRSPDPTSRFMWDVGRQYFAQEAIATGFFQGPEDYTIAKSIHSPYAADGECGRIEAASPSVVPIAREELQLDALFRVSRRLLKDTKIASAEVRTRFEAVAAKDHRSPTTSRDRFEALKILALHWTEGDRHEKFRYLDRRIYDALAEFLPRTAAMFAPTGELSDIDDAAVWDLGI